MPLFQRAAALAGALVLCASAAQAAVTYNFSVDTSSIAGTTGFIELQFANGGAFGLQQDATATIHDFAMIGGAFTEADPHGLQDFPPLDNVFGDVTGALPGAVVMTDVAHNFDDYLQGFQFGSAFSFNLTLSGPAVDASACAGGSCSLPAFSLDLLNADGTGFLLTGDPTGVNGSDFVLGQVQVNADGSASPVIFPGPDGGPAALTIAVVPEPTAWALMLAGFGGVGGLIRQRRRAAFS